jgi:predicted amidohydrolase
MRIVNIAGAQMGAIQKDEPRQAVVERMLKLMRDAKGSDLIVFPELTLTTFFPRYFSDVQSEIDVWFEREMPNAVTQPLFDLARQQNMAMSFGYAELTPERRHFNTAILVDKQGQIVGRYRKVHLPGHAEVDSERTHQHLEKYYFEPGDLGFPVCRTMDGIFGMAICNDRRWPETYRVMGLQGVEMILLGYNTPSVNSQKGAEGAEKRLFHSDLVVQSGAYQNSTWIVSIAKGGVEDGHPLIAGSIIANPDGEVVARASSEDDELMLHACDLDETAFGKQTIFDFSRHRRIEHYGRITTQTGVQLPPE